uniref:Natural cytotoxicity triggering receptor 3 n=1 Tax=Erpetoichthys calabaricus TaxID=27687 RepID=A0A8C4RQM1_ERPCA
PKKLMFIIVVNISTGVCKELDVQQDPVINVTAGETAHLHCRFSHSESSIIGSVKWYRGASKGKEVNNDTHPTGIVRVDAETFSRDKVASISILETLAQYQDTYYCEVELMGQKGTGNGTRLIVRKPENKPNTGKYNMLKKYAISMIYVGLHLSLIKGFWVVIDKFRNNSLG